MAVPHLRTHRHGSLTNSELGPSSESSRAEVGLAGQVLDALLLHSELGGWTGAQEPLAHPQPNRDKTACNEHADRWEGPEKGRPRRWSEGLAPIRARLAEHQLATEQ